jgi:ureidoglycolate lyase
MNKVQTVVDAVPLRGELFEPYGTVIEYKGESKRRYVPEAFERVVGETEPTLWLRRITQKAQLPLTIEFLERHPHSAQTFLPIKDVSHLVVVCRDNGEGDPDLSTVRAFVAAAGQGVSYRRNVWHHALTVLEGDAEFVVVMSLTERGDDDVFVNLDRPVEVRAPATEGATNGN